MSTQTTHLQVGDHAPNIEILDIHGSSVRLGSRWANGPTLVSFLRHFGCIHCRARLSVLEDNRERLEAAGLRLVTLALGEPKHAQRYCGKLAPHLECFAADSNEGYYAWGLRQGTAGEMLTHGVDVMKASVKALASGHIQGLPTGDQNMLPGTFIVDTDGIIRYAWYSRYAGDDPTVETLVDTARDLNAAR